MRPRRREFLGLTLLQLHFLKLVVLQGRHPVGHFTRLVAMSSPAATQCVDKLERLELVARSPSARDRRVTLLEATDLGRSLVDRYDRMEQQRLEAVLTALSSGAP